jgi:hypothetical protein
MMGSLDCMTETESRRWLGTDMNALVSNTIPEVKDSQTTTALVVVVVFCSV